MLDLENVPTDVTKIAMTCLLHSITFHALIKESPEHCAVAAAEAGLTFSQFHSAMNWVAQYLESHSPRGLTPN